MGSLKAKVKANLVRQTVKKAEVINSTHLLPLVHVVQSASVRKSSFHQSTDGLGLAPITGHHQTDQSDLSEFTVTVCIPSDVINTTLNSADDAGDAACSPRDACSSSR